MNEHRVDYRDFLIKDDLNAPINRFKIAQIKKSYEYYLEKIRGLRLAPFHREVTTALQDIQTKVTIVEMPREHGKSTLCCEDFLAWYGFTHPYQYALVFSNTADQANKRGRQIKSLIERIRFFRPLMRNTKEDWGTKYFMLKNFFRVEMFGVGAGIAGARHLDRRPDVIILDDVVPDKLGGVLTDKVIIQWYLETVVNLGGPDTRIIIIGTPYRQGDLLDYVMKEKNYTKLREYNLPTPKILRFEALLGKDIDALKDDTTETLWPAHWPLKRLRMKFWGELQGNSIVFARQYLCRTVTEGAKLYPQVFIDRAKLDYHFTPDRANAEFNYDAFVMGVDLASSAEAGADFFVCIVLGVTSEGKLHLVWLERHHGLTFRQQNALVFRLQHRFGLDLTAIEQNSYQVVFAQEIENGSEFPVHRHKTTSNKHDELIGLPLVRTHFENGRIFFPTARKNPKYTQMTFDTSLDENGNEQIITNDFGGETIEDSFEILLEEMSGYQRIDGKWESVMEHDDCPMCLWMAVLAATKYFTYGMEYVGELNFTPDPDNDRTPDYLPIDEHDGGYDDFSFD